MGADQLSVLLTRLESIEISPDLVVVQSITKGQKFGFCAGKVQHTSSMYIHKTELVMDSLFEDKSARRSKSFVLPEGWLPVSVCHKESDKPLRHYIILNSFR